MTTKTIILILAYAVIALTIAALNWHRGIDVVVIATVWSAMSLFMGYRIGKDDI